MALAIPRFTDGILQRLRFRRGALEKVEIPISEYTYKAGRAGAAVEDGGPAFGGAAAAPVIAGFINRGS